MTDYAVIDYVEQEKKFKGKKIKFRGALVVDHKWIFHFPPRIDIINYKNMGMPKDLRLYSGNNG